ncbi:MAG: hypothetical protein RLY20_112 [Verrucomicrobiota bacterium]|jgi:hypothetical protein
MNWYYVENGQQVGPMPEAQLDALAQNGTINEATLVWCDGMADWQPLSAVRPSAVSQLPPVLPPILSPLPVAPETVCVECGLVYAPGDLIKLNNCFVCATCKPKFIQRMAEGIANPSIAKQVWKSKKEVVLGDGTPLPDRCICCNEPANGYRLKRKLTYTPNPHMALLVGVLIYAIMTRNQRKQSTVLVGMCEKHRSARKRDIILGLSGFVLGIAGLCVGAAFDNGFFAVVGVLLMIGGIILAAVRAQVISVSKIENNIVRFKGAGKPFLASLPDWTGPK